MKRREFIALTGGAAAVWPLIAGGQTPVPIVGFMAAGSRPTLRDELLALTGAMA
jgi:hypothetical protein